jgi:hypothetical protein
MPRLESERDLNLESSAMPTPLSSQASFIGVYHMYSASTVLEGSEEGGRQGRYHDTQLARLVGQLTGQHTHFFFPMILSPVLVISPQATRHNA